MITFLGWTEFSCDYVVWRGILIMMLRRFSFEKSTVFNDCAWRGKRTNLIKKSQKKLTCVEKVENEKKTRIQEQNV